MLLREAIQNTIDKLDPVQDVELIASLMDKLSSLSEFGRGLSYQDLTLHQLSNLNKTIRCIVDSTMNEAEPKYHKAKEVYKRIFNCGNCKHHVLGSYEYEGEIEYYPTKNPNSDVCKSCRKRCSMIYNFYVGIEERWEDIKENTITEEHKLCIHLIHKIQRKIKSIKHEASKH